VTLAPLVLKVILERLDQRAPLGKQDRLAFLDSQQIRVQRVEQVLQAQRVLLGLLVLLGRPVSKVTQAPQESQGRQALQGQQE
jgi:hypothetical protein